MNPILNPVQQNEVCEAIAKGATLEIAAAVAGCTTQTIDNTVDQDLEFDLRLEDATSAHLDLCHEIVQRAIRQPGNELLAESFQAFKEMLRDNFSTPLGSVVVQLIELEEHVVETIDDKEVQTKLVHGLRKLIRELPAPNFHIQQTSRKNNKSRKKPRDSQ
jgi:hypothetical protein